MNRLLKRPEMPCYVIKRPFTHTYFTIDATCGKKTLIAFKDKDHAHTFKRLYVEIELQDKKKHKTISVERLELGFLERTCMVSGLDLMLYNSDSTVVHYEALKDVNDDVLFALENKFRYGG